MENTAQSATANEIPSGTAPSQFRNRPQINSREARYQEINPQYGIGDDFAGPGANAQDGPNQRPSQYNSTDHAAAMDGEEVENSPFASDDLKTPDGGEVITFNLENYSHQRDNGFATSQLTF